MNERHVTVTATSTLLTPEYGRYLIFNHGNKIVFIGDEFVTTSTGIPLRPGECVESFGGYWGVTISSSEDVRIQGLGEYKELKWVK